MDNIDTPPANQQIIEITGSEHLTVPGGAWVLKADFVHQGPDLLLVGPDGESALIIDFFKQTTPPDLVTDFGAVVSAELASKLAGPANPGQYAQAAPTNAAEPIGRIETLSGTAEVTHSNGTKSALSQGSSIFSGDVIETGDSSAIGLVLADDSTLSLAESGRMVMDDIVYDAGAETGNATISIVQGVFSFVSGQIAKTGPDAMVLKTPVATLGIRGTKIAGSAAAEGEQNTISLLPDDDGSVGEIAVFNSAGTIVLNQAGATTQLTSAFQAPPPPIVLPVAQIQQQFSSALNSLPPTPVRQNQDNNNNRNDDNEGAPEEEAPQEEDPEGEEEGEAPPEGEGEGEPTEEELLEEEEERLEEEAELDEAEAREDGELPPEGDGEGDGELEEGEAPPEGEGDGEEIAEGDANPDEAASTLSADSPIEGSDPEGPAPGDQGPQSSEIGPIGQDEGGAPEVAFQQALAGGATTQEAFEAAAEAAIAEAIANGATEEQAEAMVAAAQDAFQQAIADGFTMDQALQLAGDAAGQAVPEIDGGNRNDSTFDQGSHESDGPIDPVVHNPLSDSYGPNYGSYNPVNAGSGDHSPYDPIGGIELPPVYDAPPDDNFIYVNIDGGDNDGGGGGPTNEFTEILSASVNNDGLVGGPGNTQFTMVQGSTLGGADDVNGNGGTDEITFQNLEDIILLYNADTTSGRYSTVTGYSPSQISGTVQFTSIEQIFAGAVGQDYSDASGSDASTNGTGTGVRLSFGANDTGIGYIVAGNSSSADTITLTDNTVIGSGETMDYGLAFTNTVTNGSILGSIIFGLGGDDNITGTSSGDIIFGGADNDTIYGGGGEDSIFGGAGNDTIDLTGSTTSGSEIFGGSGTDTLSLANGTNTVEAVNVETITGGSGIDVIEINGSSNVQVTGGATSDVIMLGSSGQHTVVFSSAATNGSDMLFGFLTGSGNDVLDVDGLGFNGAGGSSTSTSAQILTGDGSLNAGTTVVVFDSSLFQVDSTDTDANQITDFLSDVSSNGSSFNGSLSADDKLLFVIGDSSSNNDLALWSWSDQTGDGGDGAGDIDSGEITVVGELDSTDISSLVASNFA